MTQRLSLILLFSVISVPNTVLAIDSTAESQCEAFFAKTEKLEWGLSRKEKFASATLALQEMKLGLDYPGYPQDREELFRKILAPESANSKDADALSAQVNSMGDIEACDPARAFGWFTRLIQSSGSFHFNAGQKHALESLLMTSLRNDASGPRTLLQQQLNLKLVQLANEHFLLKLSANESRLLETELSLIKTPDENKAQSEAKIEKNASEVVSPADSSLEKHREQRTIRLIRKELQESERLRSVLRQILEL